MRKSIVVAALMLLPGAASGQAERQFRETGSLTLKAGFWALDDGTEPFFAPAGVLRVNDHLLFDVTWATGFVPGTRCVSDIAGDVSCRSHALGIVSAGPRFEGGRGATRPYLGVAMGYAMQPYHGMTLVGRLGLRHDIGRRGAWLAELSHERVGGGSGVGPVTSLALGFSLAVLGDVGP